MFGSVGGPELILIVVIALIVFGPRKLPEIGKSMGKMMAEFRKASNDFKRTIEEEVEAEERAAKAPAAPAALPPAEPPAGSIAQADPVASTETITPSANTSELEPEGTPRS